MNTLMRYSCAVNLPAIAMLPILCFARSDAHSGASEARGCFGGWWRRIVCRSYHAGMRMWVVLLLMTVGLVAQPATQPVDGCKVPTFGPGFTGDNIEDVIERAAKSDAAKPKGEFETTEQYQRRIFSIPKDTFVFVLPPYQESEAHTPALWADTTTEAVYDADAAKMSVRIKFGLSESRLTLIHSVTSMPGYAGQNAYGASAKVEKIAVKVFGLLLPHEGIGIPHGKGLFTDYVKSHFPSSIDISRANPADLLNSYATTPLAFGVPLDAAREMKPALRLALGVESASKVVVSSDNLAPRINNPLDADIAYRFLEARIQYIAALDIRTGQILQRVGCK